jgi:single-stranded DNA-binding protein
MTLTLTGFLGKDPEIRQTKERTETRRRYNPVALCKDTFEVHIRARDYIVLSLAVHDGDQTTWHRLVVWNGDRLAYRNIRFAGKGDRVTVTGRTDTFTFNDAGGASRQIHQLVVEDFRVLRRKRLPPEVP